MTGRRYEVQFLPSAVRELEAVDGQMRRRLAQAIDALATNPRPPQAKALQGKPKGTHRIRVGHWRVIYVIEDRRLLVLVVRVAHRSVVYR